MFRIDATAFVRSMQAAAKKLSNLIVESLRRSTRQMAQYAKVNTLYKSRTGRLRSSIKERLTSRTSARVSAGARHARWVEEGTKAHIITPRRKRALRFEQDGVIRFSKKVRHPGTKPRPFMQQARDRTEPLFDRLCRGAVDRMFE